MPNTLNTPNMNLAVPVVGTETGPQYATDINNCFTVIDQHDHSSGKGVAISSSGINVTADLPINNFNITSLRSLRLQSQVAPISLSSDLDCFYVSGVDAYFNDGNGNQIRITQSGGIAGSPGSISGLVSPAAATYVPGTATFVWQSDSTTAANLDAASIILRNLTASSNGITLSVPSALGSNYTVTLPALPASQKFMTLDASGNMSAPWAVDNSTLQISSNTLQIKDNGITGAKLNSGIVDNSTIEISSNVLQVKNLGITQAKLAIKNVIQTDGTVGYSISGAEVIMIATTVLPSYQGGAISVMVGESVSVTNGIQLSIVLGTGTPSDYLNFILRLYESSNGGSSYSLISTNTLTVQTNNNGFVNSTCIINSPLPAMNLVRYQAGGSSPAYKVTMQCTKTGTANFGAGTLSSGGALIIYEI